MKKTIARNITIVSAIFVAVFSIMLITNYFQVRGSDTLQMEVVETLKQMNDANADNPQLKEQIRSLDLLARKAYFISHERLMLGVYILLGMAVILIVSLRIFYAEVKNIPDKEIDPIDDWAIKTSARKYVQWTGGGLIAAACIFALLASPWLQSLQKDSVQQTTLAEIQADNFDIENVQDENVPLPESDIVEPTQAQAVKDSSSLEKESVPKIEISNVTHNSFRGNNSNGISSARNVPTSWDLSSGKIFCGRYQTRDKEITRR